MAKNEIVPQYYNLFDATKGYTELLFRAGKVLQSKELNELQSVLKNQIKNVGDTILTNGDIIEGCQLIISDDRHKVTLTKGRIYLDGNVRDVPITELDITGEGTEVIGATLVTEIVTPDEDADLADIATGYDNYNQDGAYRVKETVQIKLNDPDASIMYTLTDGEQFAVRSTEDLTQLDKINATLARRTYEESGNYKIYGLKLSDKNQNDTNYIYLTLEAGKAYVQGYEVNKNTAYTIRLDRASDIRSVDSEANNFRTGTDQYKLSNPYPSLIKKVVATVEKSKGIVRGSVIGGTDYLDTQAVVSIESVTQNATTYTEGVDFQRVGNGIDWSIGSKAPASGTTYQVVWRYKKTLVKETDYSLTHSDDWYQGFVSFLTGGDKPVNGTEFTVDYDFMLYRRDVVGIDKDGNVIVVKGQSDILRIVESPATDKEHMLALGSVLLIPKSDDILVINNNTKTISMLELYNMLERINDLEYNQAITDLDQEAADGEDATQLKGILTDGFIGITKADIGHSNWDAGIDIDRQELTLPSLIFGKSFDFNTDITSSSQIHLFERLLTLDYNEIELINQSYASSTIKINSYNAFPKNPVVSLNPKVNNWIDEELITIQGETTISDTPVVLRYWWNHKTASWANSEKAIWESLGFTTNDKGQPVNPDTSKAFTWKEFNTAYSSNTLTGKKQMSDTSVSNTLVTFMKQIDVNINISNLKPNVDNIVATFNGQLVSLTASSNTYRGTQTGSLKADSKGVAKGKFRIPEGILCGTVEVKAYSSNNPELAGYTTFTSIGSHRTITTTVWTEEITITTTDPIAQSFQFDRDQFITAVGLFFWEKEASEPITVQIRNMVNGYPGTTVYATKVVDGASIKTSDTAAQETKVVFDNPVYCRANEQYCITVLSDSTVDSIWLAETTKTDVTSKTQISKNPYLNGVMFSSSNALTWTAHQSQDLKLKLYGARFQTNGQFVLGGISPTSINDFTSIMFELESSLPAGCLVTWQYAINDQNNWLPIESYSDRELNALAESIKLRCNLSTEYNNVSPTLAMDTMLFYGFKNKNQSTYVSRNVPVNTGFNHVKVILDAYLPDGCNIYVYYATDTEGTNWLSLTASNITPKSTLYKTYTFEANLAEIAYNYRVKVILTTNDPLNRPSVQNLKNIMKTM